MLNGVLIDKIDVGENFLIETPSFIVNYTKLLLSSNSTSEIPFQNRDLFKIPPFCNLANSIDCMEDKIVLLKVSKKIQFYVFEEVFRTLI